MGVEKYFKKLLYFSLKGRLVSGTASLRSANKGLHEHTYQFDSHASHNTRKKIAINSQQYSLQEVVCEVPTNRVFKYDSQF